MTGNYKVKFEASESCRRHVGNKIRGLRGVETWPCKFMVFIVYKDIITKNSTIFSPEIVK